MLASGAARAAAYRALAVGEKAQDTEEAAKAITACATRYFRSMVPWVGDIPAPLVMVMDEVGGKENGGRYVIGTHFIVVTSGALDSIPHELFHYYQWALSTVGMSKVSYEGGIFSDALLEVGAYLFHALFRSRGGERGTLGKLWERKGPEHLHAARSLWHYARSGSLKPFLDQVVESTEGVANGGPEAHAEYVAGMANTAGNLIAPLAYTAAHYDARVALAALIADPSMVLDMIRSSDEGRMLEVFGRLEKMGNAQQLTGNARDGANWMARR